MRLQNTSAEDLVFPGIGLWRAGEEREFPDAVAEELLRNANIIEADLVPASEGQLSEQPAEPVSQSSVVADLSGL